MSKSMEYRAHCARVFAEFYDEVSKHPNFSHYKSKEARDAALERELRLAAGGKDHGGAKIRRYLSGRNVARHEDFESIRQIAIENKWCRAPGFLRRLAQRIPSPRAFEELQQWESDRIQEADEFDSRALELAAWEEAQWSLEKAAELERLAAELLQRAAHIRKYQSAVRHI